METWRYGDRDPQAAEQPEIVPFPSSAEASVVNYPFANGLNGLNRLNEFAHQHMITVDVKTYVLQMRLGKKSVNAVQQFLHKSC